MRAQPRARRARWRMPLCPVVSAALSVGLVAALGCASAPSVEDTLSLELERHGLLARKTERGLVLYLPDVLFDFDSDQLTSPAQRNIEAVADLIGAHAPERTVSVEGHSDAVGTEKYNLGLSLRRAGSVEDALVRGGVSTDLIVMVGYGERFPVSSNEHADGRDNPEGRSRNRRVEVVIERDS